LVGVLPIEGRGAASRGVTTDRAATEEQEAAFLLDLGHALYEVALPSNAVERRLREVSRALGTRAQSFVLQGFLCVQVGPEVVGRVALQRTSFDTSWRLARLTDLACLVRALSAGTCALTEGRARLDAILAEASPYPGWLVLAAYATYGGAVAARVGGRWLEVLVAAAVGALAGKINFGTVRFARANLQKSFLAALAGALVALLVGRLLPSFDVARATFGGIALLVPAMVLTLATAEMANGALESGVIRLAYGLLRFLMLGFGMAAAARLWMLFGALPAHFQHAPLPGPVVLALVAVGGAALTVCMQARPRDLPWIVGAATLAYGVQELTKMLLGGHGSPLAAAFVLGVAGLGYARLPGRAAGTVLFPGLLQLAPGFIGIEAVVTLLGERAGGERFFDVLMTALQLVTGLLLAEALLARRERLGPEPSPAAEQHRPASVFGAEPAAH
jgi:uncharacterized membrane protein YjjP (DUF1212 family)